jgi:ATP-dependent helicase YprA (DUF1998 family)
MVAPSASVHYSTPINTLKAVRERATEAVLLQSGINNQALSSEIRKRFDSSDIEAGALVREPVLEATYPYVAGDKTLADVSGTLLHPKVVDALTADGPQRNYAFPREMRPYEHQLRAWELLTDPKPQSVLVTSGTGSGKTECFLMPLLHDLASEADRERRLSGVRAIAIYPLNALISSQEERLREWIAPFNGSTRFGLYNGNMVDDANGRDAPPEQVIDRRTLRADPPPILVTNVTMLEYMTVRKEDRPLLENSRSKLRWIILDEAHSYEGSKAAEMALLIRRVLLAFGVTPNDVRFVATSATIGEGAEVTLKLKRFLADVAGVPDANVHVVVGHRSKPDLPETGTDPLLSAEDLGNREKLSRNPLVQKAIAHLCDKPMSWPTFSRMTAGTGQDADSLARALATPADGGNPILPLRVHGFMRAVPGLWACLSPTCSAKPEGEWPFGAVLPERVDACPHCSGAVLEIVSCSECGEPYLDAREQAGRLTQTNRIADEDDFITGSDDEPVDDEDETDVEETSSARYDVNRLVAARPFPHARFLHVIPSTGVVCDGPNEETTKFLTHERDDGHCPACNASDSLRSFRYGAPFLIGNAAPVLLEGVPQRPHDPSLAAPLPSEGRQLLSFTDSRQGTARFAAALQGGSERNFVRAAIYHAVQDSLRPASLSAEEIQRREKDIADLELAVIGVPSLKGMLEEKKSELAKLQTANADGLPWAEVRNALADRAEINHWMVRIWGAWEQRFAMDPAAFAEFLMLRELSRRPRRANSLETLGLARLRFPHIDSLVEQQLPESFRSRGLKLEQWREFLYLLLTFRVRNSSAVRMHPGDVKWLINRRFPKVMLAPDAEKTYARELTWPAAKANGLYPNSVRLLERVLGLNVDSAEDRAEINDILREAWRALYPLFQKPGTGSQYALDLDNAYVAPVTEAYLCPVSRRLIDMTFAGISAYGLDGSSRLAGSACERFEMPTHPNPFLRTDNGGSEVVLEWLASDPHVNLLRSRGLWGNLHDRIALGSPYTRAAEHSAQQSPERLQRYEAGFKAGEINILSCSTTMEMGVDIGSVSSVMNTNVPPSIANYKQRVGRAGRRGQGFSMSLTYSRDMPLDRETFRDPVLYLTRHIEAPKVKLDSRRIVQRHVNALLLAAWFKQAGGEAMKMKAGDFFGCSPAIGAKRADKPPVAEFKEWLLLPSTMSDTASAIEILVRASVLVNDGGVYAAAKEAIEAVEKELVDEWDAIQDQAAGMDRKAARTSLGFQLKRLCDEHLLRELADGGFLPGHGFPTAVVPFVNRDELGKDDGGGKDGNGGEDNRFRRRDFPTRNLDVAIRDYAPGAEVVVDGLVYRSAGVTLNWKRPAGESAVNEIQSLKWFWQCRECGAADTTRLRPDHCTACGVDEESLTIKHFLQPAGFTVDVREHPHTEFERVAYVEPEPERVAARGAAWKPFLDPAKGRLRASRDGLVFYSSSGGSDSYGYSVCLECGRAEAGHFKAEEVRPLLDHKPLRFTKADEDGRCPGNGRGFSIQTGLALGHEINTDVTEIQPRGLDDPNAAWALAAALREALARNLGISAGELGISVSPRENPVAGRTHSVFLYDRASGGAGFAPRLVDLFEKVLQEARAILNCKEPGCLNGCSACIVTNDLFAQAETVDRRAAMAYVDAELSTLGAPLEVDVAAKGAILSRDVSDDLVSLAEGHLGKVTIWPAGTLDSASFHLPRIRAMLERLSIKGHEVTLCIEPSMLDGLDPAQRLGLRDASVRYGLRLAVASAPTYPNGALAIAASGNRIWASRDAAAGQVGTQWGIGASAPIVCFDGKAPMALPLDKDSLLPQSGTIFLDVDRQLDGASGTFGQRFAAYLKPVLEKAGLWHPGRLVSVEYMDRYVRSPWSAHLMIGAVSSLAGLLSTQKPVPFRVTTAELKYDEERTPHRVIHDWQDEDDRRQVLDALCAGAGLDLDLTIEKGLHSRRLKLVYDTDEATVVLDQGIAFLKPSLQPKFDFGETTASQAKRLSTLNVMCAAEGATYLVIVDGKT